MLGELFYWVFNMSLTAALMGLVVMAIRAIKAIPRRFAVWLWAVPFLRMCLPLGLNNPYSLMSLISRFTTRTVTVYQPAEDISFSVTNFVMAANSYFPITYKVNILEGIFSAASLLWLVAALAIIIALAIAYFTTLAEIKDARPLRENIYISEKVRGPAVYGVLRPRIVLPAGYETGDIEYILRHERSHIRRGDNLWRILAFLIAAVHWFDPLAWVFLRLFLADLELACDEAALAGLEAGERRAYALALVDAAAGKSLFVSAFGGARIRTRIENILSYKKMTRLSLAGFTALVAAVIAALITNAG